jgi:glycosyltransferase involved in cell wall biosynthesis
VASELTKYFGLDRKKVIAINEGINEAYLKKKDIISARKHYNLKNKYFIYTGNVYPHKNIERAIEAVKLLNDRMGKKVVLVIVGSRDVFHKKLKRCIRELRAEGYVKTLGFVPDSYLRSLYRDSVAFVYPSLSEGFGLQGLEVMASGTLLLASNIAVFKEIYKDNPLFFNPYDFSSIARVMQDAVEMKKVDRARRIKRARKFIRRYSWVKMARKTLAVYQDAMCG